MNTSERAKMLQERKFILQKMGEACDDIRACLDNGGFFNYSKKACNEVV